MSSELSHFISNVLSSLGAVFPSFSVADYNRGSGGQSRRQRVLFRT